METIRKKGSDSNIRQSKIQTNDLNRKCRNSPSTQGNLVYYKADVTNHWEKGGHFNKWHYNNWSTSEKMIKLASFLHIISRKNSKCTKDLNIKDGTVQVLDKGKVFLTTIEYPATT